MRLGRQEILLTLIALSLLFLAPAAVLGQASGALDLVSLLRERDPETLISSLKDEAQEKDAREHWAQMVTQGSQAAVQRNQEGLYPNPSLQAYVNRLGQSLIPKEASDNVFVTFKIVEDPFPYADSLPTGTVYLSTGMISLLDNESQMAFLLMHEASHVLLSHQLYQIVQEKLAEKRANKIRIIGTVLGAVAGGVIGGKKDAGVGAAIGLAAANVIENARRQRFSKESQLEADQFAAQVLLQHGFDAREAPTLMAKVGNIVRRSGAAVEMAFADAGDLPQRSAKVKELLGGSYQQVVARILSGNGFRMSSPRYSQLMSELKRDNGLLALKLDLFVIARANLEEAAAVRTDDPLTMYGLGVLYRTVGRTDEDAARAAGYLKSAMEFDDVRHRFPEAYLQYAVELLSREDPQRYPEIQKALKSYVALYQRNSGGGLPREMPFVYDYLDLTGDRSWIAYKVNNVRSEAPNQLTADAKIDGSVQPAEKRSPKKQ
ncbi:MAG: M48 family metalloprotease [Acidobacteria bacterium]|nr:M48 family metalloprotease [Acidobacteriota bacterium]